ncbi:hypothetical protein B566_EDAN011787 [Ephemera danica]|nr:hypothetical protein B566_EDAN011787 [Ephemera danica]
MICFLNLKGQKCISKILRQIPMSGQKQKNFVLYADFYYTSSNAHLGAGLGFLVVFRLKGLICHVIFNRAPTQRWRVTLTHIAIAAMADYVISRAFAMKLQGTMETCSRELVHQLALDTAPKHILHTKQLPLYNSKHFF